MFSKLVAAAAVAVVSTNPSGRLSAVRNQEQTEAAAMPAKACKPQSSPFPISCIDCKGKVAPQNVPFDDISKLWGVWYTVGSEKSVAIPDASCTQVNLHAHDSTNATTKLDYEGFFCNGQPSNSTTTCTTAVGDITPTSGSFSPDQPPYQLRIVEQVPFITDFYFAATDGDASGDGITAMVTLSCPHVAQAFSGSQAFILSRTPQITAKTMAILMARAKAAIPNFSEHAFHPPVQNKDQCHYKWPAALEKLGRPPVPPPGGCQGGSPCSQVFEIAGNGCVQFGLGPDCFPYVAAGNAPDFHPGTCAQKGYTVAGASNVGDIKELGIECGENTRIASFTMPAEQSVQDCTDCLKCPSICTGGLKCKTGNSGGVCISCTGPYESSCGQSCCLSGQECHQGRCTIPLFNE